jgi:ribosomal protein S9
MMMGKEQANVQDPALNAARQSYNAFMAERITDDQQFGHKVEYSRSTLYEKVTDFLGKSAMFGLFLAGFRAGQSFERIQPDVAARVVNLNVDLIDAADYCYAREQSGLVVFNRTSLRNFANRVLQKVLGQPVYLAGKVEDVDSQATVEAVLDARLEGIAALLRAEREAGGRYVPPDVKREGLAYHLWTFDQQRTHGAVIGKWDHVGERYKRQLETQADILLKLAFAVEHAVPGRELSRQPESAM